MKFEFSKTFFLKQIFSISFFCFLSIYMFLSVAFSSEDESGIVVIGTGIIYRENTVEARNNAISDAIIKGVEEYLVKDLGSQNMISNFPRLVREILPDSKDAVENFHILAEEQTDKHYKILVRIKVNQQIIGAKLKDIKRAQADGPPVKVLFLVSMESVKDGNISYWWGGQESGTELTAVELALYRAFQGYGFEPVDRLLIVPEESYTLEMRELRLSDEDAVRWGRIFASDVVISGTCKIVKDDAVYVDLKWLNVENGDTIHSDQQVEYIDTEDKNIGQAILLSMEKAIAGIAMRMGPEVISALAKKTTGMQKFEIRLNGLKGFEQFTAFSDFLKQGVAGVKEVTQTRIKGSSMTILIGFEGDKNQFFEKISKNENLPFPADVKKSDDDWITITLD